MKNKNLLLIVVAGALGFALAYAWFHHAFQQSLLQQQADFSKKETAWEAEKSSLEAALANARGQVTTLPGTITTLPGTTKVVEVTNKISPAEILARLQALRVVPDQPRTARQVVHLFETLTETGTAALPVIRDFLAGTEDVDYDLASLGRSARSGKLPADFIVPPSLRIGLFETLKNIGGADAEKILADTLGTTGRGVELAYLTRVLERLSPGSYRAAALAAAHELLAHPRSADATDRNFLLATLTALGDTSFAAQAQTQLIKPDGTVDAAALKYLQQTGGDKALALVMQAYADPRVTDPKARERLVQVALDTPGINPQVDEIIRAVLADNTLPPLNRNNLVQEYADRGYNNFNDPTADDFLKLKDRLAQLEKMPVEGSDPLVISGIMEAIKDVNESIDRYRSKHPGQ